jgi:ribosomal protein S27AE
MDFLGGTRLEINLKDGTCPKCNQHVVYHTENDTHKILPHTFGGLLNLDSRPAPVVDNFVCGNCGYVEFYVRPKGLEIVKNNWERI